MRVVPKCIMFLFLLVILYGCQYRLLFDKPVHTQLKDVIRLKYPRPDFMNVVETVSVERGYTVRKSVSRKGVLDPSMDQSLQVLVSSGGFGIGQGMTGVVQAVEMQFDSSDGGKSWNCTIHFAGNSSYGKDDAALVFWSEFKPKLLNALKQSISPDILEENAAITPPINQPLGKSSDQMNPKAVKIDGVTKPELKPDTPPKTKKSSTPPDIIYIDKNGRKTDEKGNIIE